MQTGEQVLVLASANPGLRQRLRGRLTAKRWQVREAAGGAAAMALLEECQPEALLLDTWLPDLETGALAEVVQQLYPGIDLVRLDGQTATDSLKSLRKHELLHAIREAGTERHWDGAIWNLAGSLDSNTVRNPEVKHLPEYPHSSAELPGLAGPASIAANNAHPGNTDLLPGMVGDSAAMRELARLVRLVAPHPARVLIEGETGSGKELVARAIHTLSGRESKPFVALNCAAIPETLLEAELFGHTRGAFTGAVHSRLGRIEAANGGTLFLDEIGELPLALQAKLLRFLENGELQRIGGNETVRVDVRVVSATHQLLEERAEKGSFRLDLYHRLAAFPVEVPSLRERLEDLPSLVSYFLIGFGQHSSRKQLSAMALHRLAEYAWPGNVRELQNVLQRAVILSDQRCEIGVDDLKFGHIRRS